MPAGVSWPRYLFFVGAAIASMLAGGATVRWILKPNLTVPELPPDQQSELHSKSKDD